jgi:hypothetical protein
MSPEPDAHPIKSLLSRLSRHPAFLGLLIGVLAAFTQALLISAGGPEAYGVCIACHVRDLVNGMTNIIAGTSLALAPISKNAILPVMGVAGIMAGAFISAKTHREHRIKKADKREYFLYFAGGLAVLFLTMIFGGCPYRAALRTGYGDLTALLFIIMMAIGVGAGTLYLLRMAEKEES